MTRVINIFRCNLLKKLIALIAAFLMWVFVMAEQDPAINGSYTVPLTISNAPYEFMPICENKTMIIDARAPRSKFAKYDAQSFRVYVNLEGLGEGAHQITPQVIMPQGFELVEMTPSIVTVKLDPLTERQMPIELMTTGSVASDSAIREINKSMNSATVIGPKSFIDKVKRVYGTVNLSGNTSSFELQIPLRTVDEKENLVPNVRVVPSIITVSIDIESGLKKKIVPIVSELTAPDGWELTKITVEPAQTEISGAESLVNSIVTLKTVPFTVQTGQKLFKSTLKLDVPEGIMVKDEEVTVSAEVIRRPIIRDRNAN